MEANNSRRRFITRSALALSILPILSGRLEFAHAQDAPKQAVDPDSPVAKALHYFHDAAKATSDPAFKAGSKCSGCALFKKLDATVPGQQGKWGKCTVLTQGLVNENGWCLSFAPKPA